MGSKLSGVTTGMERLSLDPIQAAKISAVRECLEFVISR